MQQAEDVRCFLFSSLTFPSLCVVEKWQAVYTILEAFGNASTCMNGNASRFSHVVSLDFDQTGMVTSASIQVDTKLLCIHVSGAKLPNLNVRFIFLKLSQADVVSCTKTPDRRELLFILQWGHLHNYSSGILLQSVVK